METITLFAVDDSDEYLDSLEQIFKPYAGQYDLVGTHSYVRDDEGVEELLDKIETIQPDIVLMDFSFVIQNRPDDFGVELTKRVLQRQPEQKIIMLSFDNLDPDSKQLNKIKRSFRVGAIAYLRKSAPLTWFEGFRETIQGAMFVDPILNQTILKYFQKGNTYKLKEREIEVLHFLAQDNTSRDISTKMGIGYDGVNFHIGNAKIKLNAKTLQGLVAKAIREGVI